MFWGMNRCIIIWFSYGFGISDWCTVCSWIMVKFDCTVKLKFTSSFKTRLYYDVTRLVACVIVQTCNFLIFCLSSRKKSFDLLHRAHCRRQRGEPKCCISSNYVVSNWFEITHIVFCPMVRSLWRLNASWLILDVYCYVVIGFLSIFKVLNPKCALFVLRHPRNVLFIFVLLSARARCSNLLYIAALTDLKVSEFMLNLCAYDFIVYSAYQSCDNL